MIRCPICNGTGQQPVLQIDDADRLIGISSKTCGICGGTCQVPAHPSSGAWTIAELKQLRKASAQN